MEAPENLYIYVSVLGILDKDITWRWVIDGVSHYTTGMMEYHERGPFV